MPRLIKNWRKEYVLEGQGMIYCFFSNLLFFYGMIVIKDHKILNKTQYKSIVFSFFILSFVINFFILKPISFLSK